jgi:hypothetical protein
MTHGRPGADPATMRPDNRSVLPSQCDHESGHAYCSRCCPCAECWEIRDDDYRRSNDPADRILASPAKP